MKHQFDSLMEQQKPDLDSEVEIREEVRKDEEEEVDTAHWDCEWQEVILKSSLKPFTTSHTVCMTLFLLHVVGHFHNSNFFKWMKSGLN